MPVIDYDKSRAVHSIAFVTPYTIDEPVLIQGELNSTMNTPFLGGAVAALIIGGVELDRQSKFNSMVQSQGFIASDILYADIANALVAKGYIVISTPAPRPDTKFLAAYPSAKADAYLDVIVLSYGYGQQGFDPYGPVLDAKYRLVRAKDNQTIMQGTVAYTGSSTNYQFGSYGDFSKDMPQTVAGLKEELSEVSASIIKGL